MKVLLLGEYSNVHATLAEGLRCLGHEVTLASNGDFWKNYPRDIDLARRPGRLGGLRLMARIHRLLPKLTGYDVVQIVNPMFVELKAGRIGPIYDYLRRHNGKIVLGAYGMDWCWVNTCCTDKPLRYSDFNIGNQLRTNADALRERSEWIGTAKETLNRRIAADCHAIVAGLYEYWACYSRSYAAKTTFIPFPIKMPAEEPRCEAVENRPLRVFIGINKARSEYKGTDIMLQAALDVMAAHPDRMTLLKAESVPFDEYRRLMDGSDAILDQLYSYTPSMNPLLAMSKGIVCIGGGEPENYDILGEKELRPIVNVQPNYESVYAELERLVLHPEIVADLKRQSVEYVRRHHDYIAVAGKYAKLYAEL